MRNECLLSASRIRRHDVPYGVAWKTWAYISCPRTFVFFFVYMLIIAERTYSATRNNERSIRTNVWISDDVEEIQYQILEQNTRIYSQLRVIRKQENGQPPRFLGNFLFFRVSPLSFLGGQQTGRAERPSVLEAGAKTPQFLLEITKFTPQFLNVSVSFHPQLAVRLGC